MNLKDHGPFIYFTTLDGEIKAGGINAYSVSTSEVRTIVSSNESCYAIAYDSIRNKIYWSTYSHHTVYRSSPDGTEVELVFNVTGRECFEILLNCSCTFSAS